MHSPTPGKASFKRQVVFRIDADDWPLLETAAREHGSIQAAVLAGIRALDRPEPAPDRPAPKEPEATQKRQKASRRPPPKPRLTPPVEMAALDPHEEIRAREAAKLLGLRTDTVCGYIRSGRLPGRYDAAPSWRGWLTTQGAVIEYERTRRA